MDEQDKILEEEIKEEMPSVEAGQVQETPGMSEEHPQVEDSSEEDANAGVDTGEEVPSGADETSGQEEEEEDNPEEDSEDKSTDSDNNPGEPTDNPPTSESVQEEHRSREDLLAEIEDLKYQQETEKSIREFSGLVQKQEKDFADFNKVLEQEMLSQFEKYGIPLDADIDELKEVDPAKYQIFNNIMTNAQNIRAQVENELRNPIIEASNNIIFRTAGSEMKKYKLTPDQLKEAAGTFVTIMNEVGIKDLGDDLKGKVELAVARAKMVVGEVAEVSQHIKQVAKDTTKAIQDTVEDVKDITTKAKAKTKNVTKPSLNKDLSAFTQGATPGQNGGGVDVTRENVMSIYLSKEGTDRLEFFKKYQSLILDCCKPKSEY